MSKKIKAVIIDPILRIVKEAEIEDNLDGLQGGVGGHNIETALYIDDSNVMFVDSEGLFRPDQQFFVYGEQFPLAGQAVVVGTGKDGETIGTTLTALDVAKKVGFHTASEIAAMGIGR